jgi:flagellar capping protein FliD
VEALAAAVKEAKNRELVAGNVVVVAPNHSGGARQWTIKGIAPEAVEISREAARRNGMKLNSWVGAALKRAAASNDAGTYLVDRDEDVAAKVADLQAYMETEFKRLHEQSAQMEQTINSLTSFLVRLYADKGRD